MIQTISKELNIRPRQVEAVLKLLGEGATIPFISRYRKEMTGSLDEVAIASIRDRAEQLTQLEKRREAILKSLDERELLTKELKNAVQAAESMSELEDVYLPYRPKRRTRAIIAREKGLEPLANLLLKQQAHISPEQAASSYINAEKGVADAAEALKGARDIIAEIINEDAQTRSSMRNLYFRKASIQAKLILGKEEAGQKYKDYFNWNEAIAKIPSHRLLALRRAEKELILSLNIAPEEEDALNLLHRRFVRGRSPISEQVEMAAKDAYKRLLGPSMETEVRIATKEKADEAAIRVFSENLRQLLLASPLGKKRVLALDPGFRTGCKLVCLDEQGNLLHYSTIYPHPPQNDRSTAKRDMLHLIQSHQIEAIAVGNGTAGRETEEFLQSLGLARSVMVVMVNESGASIYSASEVARNEFPDLDLTVRGAVSIGRRLMDPLAELVKIDAKSIGVGQYQHDVDQPSLKKSLDETVMSCVNKVGVELNTASKELLMYVSGLGPTTAQNVLDYRKENGSFSSRKQLLKVPRIGPKVFEQAAGFLRINGAKNPLDASAVHPESYAVVEAMAKDLGVRVGELMGNADLRKKIRLEKFVTDKVGMPTLQDILAELEKPGRDPREKFEAFAFAEGIHSIEDLHEGMWLPGVVNNITDFGAFVDIGVKESGLVHISELANRFVKHPTDVVKLQQKVQAKVLSIDLKRKRIALSLKEDAPQTKESEYMRVSKKRKKR